MKILNKVYENYFKYLCDQARLGKKNGFGELALSLFETDFLYLIPDDENRNIDGIEERERFIYSCRDASSIEKIFLVEDFPCSVFELMLGVARRMDNYAYDLDEGSRIYLCFYTLLDNLRLSKFNDDEFDELYVNDILSNFVNRTYKPNGQGSLFPLKHPEADMRIVPIWNQMTAFLNENNSKLPKSLGFIL